MKIKAVLLQKGKLYVNKPFEKYYKKQNIINGILAVVKTSLPKWQNA